MTIQGSQAYQSRGNGNEQEAGRRPFQQDGEQALQQRPHAKSWVMSFIILVLPTLLQDITGMADKWGNDCENGRIDPFVEIFEVSISPATRAPLYSVLSSPSQLVPLMTARIATCHDLTKNEVDLGGIKGSSWTLKDCATPTALILPWFPSLARVGQLMAHYKIFRVLRKIYRGQEARRAYRRCYRGSDH